MTITVDTPSIESDKKTPDSWEERMAARARERAKCEAVRSGEHVHADAMAAFNAAKDRPWLNGWTRVGPRFVHLGGGTHCVCCGQLLGVTCFVPDPNWEAPPEPVWPFTPADCPICPKW